MSKKETLKEKIYEAIGSSANVVGIINQSLATQKVLNVISEEQGGRQTAVEWFLEQLDLHYNGENEMYYSDFVEKAKEMEKQQMKDAALCSSTKHPIFRKLFEEQFEQYYKKTFKKD